MIFSLKFILFSDIARAPAWYICTAVSEDEIHTIYIILFYEIV